MILSHDLALALVCNALWMGLLGQPHASVSVSAQWFTVPEATDKIPGIGGPLKGLAVSSLTSRWLSLPPFPAPQTLGRRLCGLARQEEKGTEAGW